MGNESLLREEIREDFNALAGTSFGSEEFKTGVDGVCKLMDREIELKKIEMEAEDKKTQRKDDNIHKIIGHVINVAGIVIPVIVTVWGTKYTVNFEQTGTQTTTSGRAFFNRLFKK